MKQLSRHILIVFIVLTSASVWSQQSYYSCYTGETRGKNIRLHLIKSNNKLNASLLVKEQTTEAVEFTLSGKLNSGGDFYLGQNFDSDTILFGRLTKSHLEAFFKHDETDLILMRLQTESAVNHLDIDIKTLELQQPLDTTNPDSPQAIFEGQLLLPKQANALLDSLFMKQADEMYRFKINQLNEILSFEAKAFFAGYKKLNSFEDKDSPIFQWIKSSEVFIQLNQQQLFSFAVADYAYTGGAHGLSTKRFIVLDIKNLNQLTIGDVFKAEALNKLPDLLEKSLRIQYQISADSSLHSAGFFVVKPEITDNFWLSAAGVGFYYNSYEIAPYSFGHTPILLPYSQLEGLLKPEIVSRLNPIQKSLNPQP